MKWQVYFAELMRMIKNRTAQRLRLAQAGGRARVRPGTARDGVSHIDVTGASRPPRS
jgi:hypothetical protein